MKSFALIAIFASLLLVGCDRTEQLKNTLSVTKQVSENQEIISAGKDVLDGSKEIAGTIAASSGKIISGGRVLLDESQQILNELKVEKAEVSQPESGDTVWVREDTQDCEDSQPCFAWRSDETSPWQKLEGHIENLDDLPAQIDNWQVKISALNDFLEAWNVEEILSTDGE